MTAAAHWNVDTGISLDLVCDECGQLRSWAGASTGRWRRLWRAARAGGWQGPAGLAGPHLCRDCAAAGPEIGPRRNGRQTSSGEVLRSLSPSRTRSTRRPASGPSTLFAGGRSAADGCAGSG
jgi:hypothetical protein